MENKINIAELLKDCPQGMELDCTLFEGLEFDGIVDNEYLPIRCRVKNPNGGYNVYNFTKYGCWIDTTFAKCLIFPKGKITWDGFVPPCKFKDGDIVYVKSNEQNEYIIIFKEIKNDHIHKYVCLAYQRLSIDKRALCHFVDAEIMRLATEEEKQKIFQAIKDNGYKWNSETKTLEKLPKFKVGDRIKYINGKNKDGVKEGITLSITNDTYDVAVTNDMGIFVPISEQDNWELAPNKFDITTLKPFDKVLVRDGNKEKWNISFYGFYDIKYDIKYPYECCGNSFAQCIPYEGNEHLLGTTNDCDKFYKNW